MKRVAVLYTDYSPVIDAIKYKLADICQISFFSDSLSFDYRNFDLVVLVNYKGIVEFNALAAHYSLLPAFDSAEPVRHAIEAGVKITGISIYYTETKKIVAQYPVFITNDMHYDDLIVKLAYLEQMFLPLVIEKLINNEQFELSTVFKSSGCGGCKGCKH